MPTVKCDKTGIEFETQRPRKVNYHPQVQAWLEVANKEGWYGPANNAIYGNDAAGIPKQKFDTIEVFNAYFTDLQARSLQENQQRASERRQSEQEIKDAKRERHITNDLLRGRGYKWHDLGFKDEEEADAFDINAPVGPDWRLYFEPENREVLTVQEAMQELAFQNVTFAKDWLAQRHIEEVIPTIEIKRREEAAIALNKQIERERREQDGSRYKEQLKRELIDVLHFTEERAEQEAERMNRPHTASEDRIPFAQAHINLPDDDDSVRFTIGGERIYLVGIGSHSYTPREIVRLYDFLHFHHDLLLLMQERNRLHALEED
jgi:hypothetical protein